MAADELMGRTLDKIEAVMAASEQDSKTFGAHGLRTTLLRGAHMDKHLFRIVDELAVTGDVRRAGLVSPAGARLCVPGGND